VSKADDNQVIDPVVLDALQNGLLAVSPPLGLRARILARIQEPPSAGLMTVRGGADGWHALQSGVDYKMLHYDERGGTKSFLLRVGAGVRLPPHGHHAYEECLVLEGEFTFGDTTLRAGDFHGAEMGTHHTEVFTKTGVTVYLRASVLDYPGIGP